MEMESLVLASYLTKNDREARRRREQLALEEAGIGFRRAVAAPLATLAGVGLFAVVPGLVH
jgi:hypothetical protein